MLVTFRPGVPIEVDGVRIDYLSPGALGPQLEDVLDAPSLSRGLAVVPIEALIYMKLRARRRQDLLDVVELINAGADVRRVRCSWEFVLCRKKYILLCILTKEAMPMQTAIAKVFTSGNSQAIRLPKEFRLDSAEVFIHRSGDSLILTPRMATWDGFAAGLSGFSPDFTVTGGLEADAARTPFA